MNKRNMVIVLALLIVMVIGSTFLFVGQTPEKTAPQSNEKGTEKVVEQAPAIVLKDLDGNEVNVTYFEGEKVYVKFWASWCSICLAGMEELNQLAGMDNDFKIITIVAPGHNGEQKKDDFIPWFKSLDYDNIQAFLEDTKAETKAYNVRT